MPLLGLVIQKLYCWRAPLDDFVASFELSQGEDSQGVVVAAVGVDVVTLWAPSVDLV